VIVACRGYVQSAVSTVHDRRGAGEGEPRCSGLPFLCQTLLLVYCEEAKVDAASEAGDGVSTAAPVPHI